MVPHGDESGTVMDEYADLQASIPALNVRAGMARAMGRRKAYMQLLDKFRCRFADFSAVLQDHLAAQDNEAAVIQAHSLKGIAASLGAEELCSIARELEQQLRQDHAPGALPCVENLLDELMQQLGELDWNSVVAETGSPSSATGNTPADAQQWERCLEQMLIPLQKLKVHKVKDQLHQLQRLSLSPSQSDQLKHLQQLVNKYQYKQAAEYVQGLL